MIICAPLTTLFASPDIMSEAVDEAIYGEEVEIKDELGGFYRVVTDYGYSGWAAKGDICEKLHEPNYIVVTPFSDLLFEGRNYLRPAMTLPRGARVDVGFSHEEKRYGFVVLPSKRVYFIHKKHIMPIEAQEKNESELRNSLLSTAESFLGVQYRWGGRTHNGIDCSGLCFNAYRYNGITIWRDAKPEKFENLRKIPLESAKTGDLLFFEGHMAMYAGDGVIIHSSASEGCVCKEKLCDNKYLKERFLVCGTVFE